jgi:hypothetical protein
VDRSAGTAVAEGIRRGAERRQGRLHLEAEGERLVRASQRVPSVTQHSAAALERAGAQEAHAVELAPERQAAVQTGGRARRRDPSGRGNLAAVPRGRVPGDPPGTRPRCVLSTARPESTCDRTSAR